MERVIIKAADSFMLEDILDIPEKEVELAYITKDPFVMDQLSISNDWRVRSQIAKKTNLNSETLEMLSKDKDYLVRISVTQNENVPIKILQNMIHDVDLIVSKCAKLALEIKQDEMYSTWLE